MHGLSVRAGNDPGLKAGEICPLADDILRGADKIAEFLFGDPAERRKIYHLVEKSQLPVFRLGTVLCARKSVLLAWIAAQEARATNPEAP